MKKKLFIIGAAGVLTLAALAVNLTIFIPAIIEANDTFTIALSSTGDNDLDSINTRNGLLTERSGVIGVKTQNINEKAGIWASFGENSYFTNTDALSGLKSINVTFEGELFLDYKFINQDGYNAKEGVSLTSGVSYSFNNEAPDIFNLRSNLGADVTSIILTYSCVQNIIEADISYTKFSNYEDDYEFDVTNEYTFPTITEDDWDLNLRFTLSDDGTYYIVSDYPAGDRLHSSPTLVIPAYYKGLPVKEIAQSAPEIGAFSELDWLKNVYLPHTIERIGYGTFSLSAVENLYIDCASLEDFHGRNWVFYPSLLPDYKGMNVYFGPNVTRIPARMFYPNVTEQTFKPIINNVYIDKNAKITEIGDHAFHNVDGFKSISLPDSVTYIGEFAFYHSAFEELVLPASLKTIRNDAFAFSKIKHVKFNDELTHVGDRAFSYTALESLDLSKTSLTHIEDECFAHTYDLKHINLPTTLLDIGQRAFKASNLEELYIPDSVTIIKEEAFFYNTSLRNLYIGSGVKNIYEGAFGYATSLRQLIYAAKDVNDFASGNKIFESAGYLSGFNVYVLDGVVSLPKNMFFATSNVNELPKINTLSLPTSLEFVGEYAFFGVSIDRVNYRGVMNEFKTIVFEDNYSFENVDFGGRSNA